MVIGWYMKHGIYLTLKETIWLVGHNIVRFMFSWRYSSLRAVATYHSARTRAPSGWPLIPSAFAYFFMQASSIAPIMVTPHRDPPYFKLDLERTTVEADFAYFVYSFIKWNFCLFYYLYNKEIFYFVGIFSFQSIVKCGFTESIFRTLVVMVNIWSNQVLALQQTTVL